MRVIRFFDCLPFGRAAIPAATASPTAGQESTGKTAFYGPCKIRDAGRRPNRPPGGFSGLRPLAPASPGRPAAGPFLSRAPLLHRLPLTLPRGGLPSGQKFTFIADKIAKTKPPHLSQGYQPPLRINSGFQVDCRLATAHPLPYSGEGFSFGGQLPHLCAILGMEICPGGDFYDLHRHPQSRY